MKVNKRAIYGTLFALLIAVATCVVVMSFKFSYREQEARKLEDAGCVGVDQSPNKRDIHVKAQVYTFRMRGNQKDWYCPVPKARE